jgi:HPt (histidine-containing phosphotransfer) domain-containing protein
MSGKTEKIVINIDADLKPIIPRFFELRHDDIRSIGEALAAGDFEKIAMIGHSMKGSGGGYGFDYITEIGKSIEDAGRRRDSLEIKRWANELSNYIEKVEIVYE